MNSPRLVLPIVLLLLTAAAFAQSNSQTPSAKPATDNPYSAWNKVAYAHVTGILLRSADKMPEENYGFKPTDSVSSYGQITYMRMKNIVPPTSDQTGMQSQNPPQPKK